MKRMHFLAGLIAVLCLSFTPSVFAAADGWASVSDDTGTPYNVTGGAAGPTVTVTDEPNLIKYAKTLTGPYIVQVSGTIDVLPEGGKATSFEINANKTLRGIGTNPTIRGNTGFKNRGGNIIIENLNFTNPHAGDAYDGISLKQELHNILVTKCTFYDTGDGAFDITNVSSFVTVSWCKFYYNNPAPVEDHRLACLVGSSDKQTADANYLRVTYHHNWWTNRVKERMPRVRYGKVHVYNNYYSNLDTSSGAYCIGVGCGSRIRVESNYFNTVPKLWENYYTGQTDCHSDGHIGWNTGNIFYNCSDPGWATNEYSTIFEPPYDYMLEDTNDIPAVVQAYAGAGTPYPPHWHSTVYGDFDRNGVVNMRDLDIFADYWLGTNCAAIADADYYADCIVNFREFTLMAENWLK